MSFLVFVIEHGNTTLSVVIDAGRVPTNFSAAGLDNIGIINY